MVLEFHEDGFTYDHDRAYLEGKEWSYLMDYAKDLAHEMTVHAAARQPAYSHQLSARTALGDGRLAPTTNLLATTNGAARARP